MKEKILQMVDAYWKFDEAQQPISSWHDKQDLLKALEELLQPAVISTVCDCQRKTGGYCSVCLAGKDNCKCIFIPENDL